MVRPLWGDRRGPLGLWRLPRRTRRYLFIPRGKQTYAWLRVGAGAVRVQLSS